MQAHVESSQKAKSDAGLRLLKRCAYAAAAMFAVSGLVMLYGAMDTIPPLQQPDAVFGLSTRTVLILVGVLHLAVSGFLFATREPMTQGLIACWAGLNYIVYLAGLAWLKAAGSIPAVLVMAWELGVGERTVHIVWRCFIVYLVVVGLFLVFLEWRRVKWLEAAALLKDWHEVRETPARKTRMQNNNNTPSALPPHSPPVTPGVSLKAEFKFSCPACGQHIQCSSAYSGKEINCPACRKQIWVPEISPGAGGVGVVAQRH